MIRLLALTVVVGCSSGARSRESAGSAGSAGPAGPAGSVAPTQEAAGVGDVAVLVTPEVKSLMRSRGDHILSAKFAMTLALSRSTSTPPCWTKLGDAVVAAYQLWVGPARRSYFVLEGGLPREEVEQCVRAALPRVKVEPDGELVAFQVDGVGATYAAWRGSLLVLGPKDEVSRAVRGATPEVARAWRDRLAQLPLTPVAYWSSDAALANLLGVPTTSYVVVLDRISGLPPVVAGRVLARYAGAGDAAIAARRIKQGDLHLAAAAAPEVVSAFKQMKVSQTGTTVEIGFDLDMFEGFDLEQLKRWLQQVMEADAAQQ